MGAGNKVLIVIGTRPEALKLAPVVRALRAEPELIVRILLTAQHRELLDQALAETGLSADIDLDLMISGQSLSGFAGRCLVTLAEAFEIERPHYVIGQGDTMTTLCAAQVAWLARIPFGHVEAGLRSGRSDTPFPEERNRRLIGLLAAHHFCPTERAAANLRREGVDAATVHVTGNTGVDMLLETAARLPAPAADAPASLLVTVHRTENGAALAGIATAVRTLLDRHPALIARWPIHPNPRIGDAIRAVLHDHPRAMLTGSLPHPQFVAAMRDARLILTDSGGVQEEAPALGTPVLVLRDETERPEGVATGIAWLIGNDPAAIVAAATTLLHHPPARSPRRALMSPYGDGRAGERIARLIRNYLSNSATMAPSLSTAGTRSL